MVVGDGTWPAEEVARTSDPARLSAVRRAGLLDGSTTPALDRLAALAGRVVGARVGLVTIIGDDEQLHWAGQAGLPAPLDDARTTSFSRSLCRYVVVDDAALVLEDTRADPRVRDHLAVTELGVAAYAGVPVRAPDGEALGTLCVLDTEPRTWSPEDLQTLEDISVAVAAEIEARALLLERERDQAKLSTLADIGDALARATGHEQLASTVADQLVPRICDWCIVELEPFASSGRARRVVVAIGAADDTMRSAVVRLRELARAAPQWRSPTLDATRAKQSIYLPDTRLEDLFDGDVATMPEELAALVEQTGLRVISAVPLVADDVTIGAISFIRGDVARGFSEDELEIHAEVARQLALAVNVARLGEEVARRARAAQALDRIGDGVVLLDGDMGIALWNPGAARMLGLSADEVLGRHVDEVFPGLVPAMDTSIGGAGLIMQVRTPDGPRWLAVTGDRIGADSVFALRDITQERELERTRIDMVATVSHQLRTPVTSVLAAAITLQRDDIELGEDVRAGLLDMVVQQGRRLEELCDDVLLAYRLGNGAHTVASVPVELAPLLGELAESMAGRDAADGSIVLPSELADVRVVGDAHSLRQVFSNLIENAVKYSPEGSEVQLEVERLGDRVEVAVVDSGIGIPIDQHDAVFERFHRLDPDMARGVGGTGLGLFVVRELLGLMDGTVRVEPGDPGTRMVVTLPLDV